MIRITTTVVLIFVFIASIYGLHRSIEADRELKRSIPQPITGWTPTVSDIAYQDSMYQIINKTERGLDDISNTIDKIILKLDRLYYDDGSWDSIKLYDSIHIKNLNAYREKNNYYPDEDVMWIGGNGDTIYE